MAASMDFLNTAEPVKAPAIRTLPAAEKPSLIGLTREEMGRALVEKGVNERQVKMRVSQLWHWLYVRGVSDFDDMTNVSKDMREMLKTHFTIARPEIVDEQISSDGTRKWLLRFPPRGAGRPVEIETVYIPEEGRGTLCISSQVGCGMGCPFCATGQLGLTRNMSAGEIVEQVRVAAKAMRDGEVAGGSGRLSNIVFMGMGEPMGNYKSVLSAVRQISSMPPEGFGISARNITVSTVGVVPGIRKLAEEGIPVRLAVSLHAPSDELRDELVPMNKRFNTKQVLDAAHDYYLASKRRVSIEYALMRGINDQAEHAKLLAKRLNHYGDDWAHVNPIPLNPIEGSKWTASKPEDERRFLEILHNAGITATLRDTRGQDIDGACGQLAAKERD